MKDLIANFYELWGGAYLGSFSDQMFNNDLYVSIALYSIIMAFVLPLIYYFLLDRPGTAKLYVWGLMIFLGGVIAFIIAFVSSNNDLTDIFSNNGVTVPTEFSTDMVIFGLVNAMLSMLLIILLSIPMKFKSTHSSYIPF